MIHTKKLLRLNNSPVFIKHNKNSIDMIDNCFIHYRLDNSTYNVQKKTAIKKELTLHEYTKVFDISNDSLLVFPKKDTKSITFIKDSEGLKIVKNLNLEEAASITKFSNSSKILLIGSDTGSLWIYDMNIKKIIYTLNPRADEISSIIFTKDDKYVAIGSYDKKIEIFDTTNWQLTHTIEAGFVVEDMVFSNDNLRLYSVLRNGNILAYNLNKKEIIYNKNLGQHWLTTLKTYKSDNYALAGTRDNTFLIVDLKRGKTLKSISLQNRGLNSVDFNENNLCMAFADGSMLVCDMKKNSDETLASLKIEDFTKTKQLIDANVLLYLNGTIEKLYEKKELVLQKIITLIELGKIEEATKEALPFMENEDFSDKFDSYMSQKSEIAQFITNVDKKDFATAYKLTEEFLYIKELKKYHSLEEFWHKCFNEAKNMIAKNPNNSAEKIRAKGILQSFLNVSAKSSLIKNLLENSVIFFKADTLVKEKKFIQFFDLCQEYEFLKDTKIYNKVISITELLLTNVEKAIKIKDYKSATLTSKRLLEFAPAYEKAVNQMKKIAVLENFDKQIKDKNLIGIFKLIQDNKFLENLSLYNTIIGEFESINEDAKKHAVSGDIKETMHLFEDYLKIDYLKDRVAFTLKLAYLNSIEQTLEKREIQWKKTFLNYSELYGKDEELKNIAIKNSVLNIYDLLTCDDTKGYKKRAFKEEIVVII